MTLLCMGSRRSVDRAPCRCLGGHGFDFCPELFEKSELPGEHIFLAVGMFPVELSAYQISMVCAANWPR